LICHRQSPEATKVASPFHFDFEGIADGPIQSQEVSRKLSGEWVNSCRIRVVPEIAANHEVDSPLVLSWTGLYYFRRMSFGIFKETVVLFIINSGIATKTRESDIRLWVGRKNFGIPFPLRA